jgi:hypothetical protein
MLCDMKDKFKPLKNPLFYLYFILFVGNFSNCYLNFLYLVLEIKLSNMKYVFGKKIINYRQLV